MPCAGKGMLLTSMNIDVSDEADFNRWYDREHLEERVAIEGFLEARRYVAHAANPKYLSLYSTATLDVLDSPAYRARLTIRPNGRGGAWRISRTCSAWSRASRSAMAPAAARRSV
ncbi:hypothetical protein ACVIN2_006063 [Bradyrhizobium sp. USDA 3650]